MKIPLKLKFIVASISLLLLSLAFNALLSIHSIEKLYVESIATQYATIGKDLKRRIESAMRYGKTVEKFIGMTAMLDATRTSIEKNISSTTVVIDDIVMPAQNHDVRVSIMLPEGRILYSTDEGRVRTILPEPVIRALAKRPPKSDTSNTHFSRMRYNDEYRVSLPINGRDKNAVAYTVIAYGSQRADALSAVIVRRCIKKIFAVTVGSVLLLAVMFILFRVNRPHARYWKLRVVAAMVLSILAAQIVFSAWNVSAFQNHYLEISRQKAILLTRLLKNDIEILRDKGIQMDRMVQLDAMLKKIISASPEINNLTILDPAGNPKYSTAGIQPRTPSETIPAPESDTRYSVRVNIKNAEQADGSMGRDTQQWSIVAKISRAIVRATLFRISLDSATVIAISLLFLGEMLILFFILFQKVSGGATASAHLQSGRIRMCAFLLLFGVHISISFLPLHMETLYASFLGLPKDIVIGLPISAEMMFAGIAVIIAGSWIDHKGWPQPLFCGLFLAACGAVFSGLAAGPTGFILSRAMVGFGYGLALMAAQGYVVVNTDESSKGHGLALLFAGVYAGSMCGGAVGAMLAERIGYGYVFWVGAAVTLGTTIYVFHFLQSPLHCPEKQCRRQLSPAGGAPLVKFICNRNTACVLMLNCLPSAIAVIGFLNYFSPIYLDKIGESQSNIGRIFILYGLCLVYIAPVVSKYSDIVHNQKRFIVISGILGGTAFFSFYFFEGLPAVALTVFLLGLSASFSTGRRPYILRLDVARQLGSGKTMGMLNSVYRMGQMLGPIIIGWFIMSMGTRQGIIYLGLSFLIFSVLFLVLAPKSR